MITLNGIELEYPSDYDPDFIPNRSKHLIMNKGYKRHSTNAKHTIPLKWDNLTKDQKNVLDEIYASQFEDFETLTFIFHDARISEDMGPLEVIMKKEYSRLKVGNRYEVSYTLYEV